MKESLLGPKDKLCVGAWIVRTMYETSKTAQVTNEMQNYNLDILGISNILGSGNVTINSGQTILLLRSQRKTSKRSHHCYK
jgi:hypothetical protein